MERRIFKRQEEKFSKMKEKMLFKKEQQELHKTVLESVLNYIEIKYYFSFNELLAGNAIYKNYKIVIKQSPGEQRFLVLKEASIKRKLGAYNSTIKDLNDLGNSIEKTITGSTIDTVDSKVSEVHDTERKVVYTYDMQSLIIEVNHTLQEIYIIDGQQRLTLHLCVNMFINAYAAMNNDFNMHSKIKPLFSFEEANLNTAFELHTSRLKFNVNTINKIAINKNLKQNKKEFVSDFEFALFHYDMALCQLMDPAFLEERYNLYIKKMFNKNLNTKNEFGNKLTESEVECIMANIEVCFMDLFIDLYKELTCKEDSRYAKYIINLFTYLEKEQFDIEELHKASNFIFGTYHEKSPFETIQEALSRVGTKGEDMLASTFVLSSLFEASVNKAQFNIYYENLMNSYKNTENKEGKNDTLIQIISAKYQTKFISRSLNEQNNILTFFKKYLVKNPGMADNIVIELTEIANLLKSIETKNHKTFRKNINLFINGELTTELYDELYQLTNDNLIKEKSRFALISILYSLRQEFKISSINKFVLVSMKNVLRTINLFFIAEKIGINTLKGSEENFFTLANLFFKEELNLTEKCSKFLMKNGEYMINFGTSIEDINKMFGAMLNLTWNGKESMLKSIHFIEYMGFEERLKLTSNKDFLYFYSSQRKISVYNENILVKKHTEKIESEHIFAKAWSTALSTEDRKKIGCNPAMNISIDSNLNIELTNKSFIEKCEILARSDIKANQCYFNPKSRIKKSNNQSDLKKFTEIVLKERKKDLIIFYKDIISDYSNIVNEEEFFAINNDFLEK